LARGTLEESERGVRQKMNFRRLVPGSQVGSHHLMLRHLS
jgi:hypothetical protein